MLGIPVHALDPQSAHFFRRVEQMLGSGPLRSDSDLARLVERRLPLASLDSLTQNGLSDDEIFAYVLPRRTHEESDRAVRVARISALAEEVFGDVAKAGRWLRKPKIRFDGRSPLELLRTESGARLVEELLLQLDFGFAA